MTIDFRKAKLHDGDFIHANHFSDSLNDDDNYGNISADGWMQFCIEGSDHFIDVEFVQEIAGHFTYCPGDYWTPPDSSFELTTDEIRIVSIRIDEIEIEIAKDFERIVESLVDAEIHKTSKWC